MTKTMAVVLAVALGACGGHGEVMTVGTGGAGGAGGSGVGGEAECISAEDCGDGCGLCNEGRCVPRLGECRSAADTCDAPESCDGVSLDCPRDSQAGKGSRPIFDGCGLYLCDGHLRGCPSTCEVEADCVDGSTCVDGSCV